MVFRSRMKFQYYESNNILRIPSVMGNKVYICVSGTYVQNHDNGSTAATSGVLVTNLVWTVSFSSDLHVWAELWPYSCLAALYVLSSTSEPTLLTLPGP